MMCEFQKERNPLLANIFRETVFILRLLAKLSLIMKKLSLKKACLLITIFAIHFPFLLRSFFRREEKKIQSCGQKSYPSARSKNMVISTEACRGFGLVLLPMRAFIEP